MPGANVQIFRGDQVGWGQVLLSFYGQPALGITEFKYDEEQEMENVYGAGSFPQGTGYGNYKYSGSITMYRWQANEILTAAGAGTKIQQIAMSPATVIVNTENENYVDVVQFKFMKMSRDLKQGDKLDKVEMPILISNIKWGTPQ